MARRKSVRDFLGPTWQRGYGGARDVKAGQAKPIPQSLSDAMRKNANRPKWQRTKNEPMPHYKKRRTQRA